MGGPGPDTLVSVALCTYNGEKFLRAQLDSILSQSHFKLEIVIVDDRSTDGTIDIVKSYAAKDARVKYYINAENLGYNRNFEKAIGLCTGEYIAPSDQDDIWEFAKIETMLMQWRKGSAFIYSLSGDFFGDDFSSRRSAPSVSYSDIDDTHKLVFNSPVHGHACMFKKELYAVCTPFPPIIFYDWWISMHAASIGVIGCVPQTLTWHRVHESNSSRTLTSIRDKDERDRKLRDQCAFFIETFFEWNPGKPGERQSLLYYASLLQKMDGKKYSWSMFKYVMSHRHKIFHYKRKTFVFFSHVKHAFRMAKRGLI
jgi:glycosyltransferase involved in cell wall biosynthesis